MIAAIVLPIIVSYSDIFYTPETVAALVGAACTIALAYDVTWSDLWKQRFDDPLSDAESFKLNAASCLTEIGRKHVSYDDIEGQYMGVLKITPQAWDEISATVRSLKPERRDKLDMTGLLSLLIARGIPILAVPRCGIWGECDTETDLHIYRRWLDEGRLV